MTPLFEHTRPLVLASTSPRRQMFLRDLGLIFTVVVGDGPEPVPHSGEDPEAYAARTARHKAEAALTALPPFAAGSAPLVLAADTIVVLDGDILGKPGSEAHAVAMLRRLAGRTHTVITACCIAESGNRRNTAEPYCFADHARVTFAPWPEAVLRAYAATGEPLDKAGSYGIQGKGSFLVECIEGSWSTVVGLPVSRVADALLQLGGLRLPSPA